MHLEQNPFMNESFYRAFEDRHRGSRELIRSRLLAYLPFLEPLTTLSTPVTALDLGCGRGEWLELLAEHGIEVTGVDLDEGMLAACRERGLMVKQADALETIRSLPADSLSLITAFHVVEHLPFDDVRSIVSESLRVLKPGGLLILETPNPENLEVGTSSFYLDPSHHFPIPPLLLSFAVEHAGFARNKVVRLQESASLRAESKIGLIDVLRGVSPDYSVVAQKDASPTILESFDPPFAIEYGITLDVLTERYDAAQEQSAARLANDLDAVRSDLNDKIENIERDAHAMAARLEEYASRNVEVEYRLKRIEERLNTTEVHLVQAEARATHHAAYIQALLQSRSWRITAPLRFAGGLAKRFELAVREKRLASGIKRRAKPIVQQAGLRTLHNPRLASIAFRILNHFPTLKMRLRTIILPAQTAPPFLAKPAQLSPRAERIYNKLRNAIEAKEE